MVPGTPQATLVAYGTISNLYYLLRVARLPLGARNFVTGLMPSW